MKETETEAEKVAREARQHRDIEVGEKRLRREYEALGIEPIMAGGFLVSPTLARQLGALK